MAEGNIPMKPGMEEGQEQLTAAFNKYGMEGIKKHLEKTLEEWKEVPLYIGVTGRSGVGKSSFINAIRGLSAEDEGAAAIGVTETTTAVEQYPHPKNQQLVLCDLPGVGTPTFPRATYFTDERIGFDKFGLFLILAAGRFMEDDLWLAQGIKERNKGFLFVRTKIDQDVKKEKKAKKAFYRSNPGAIKEVISKIRDDCEENLMGFFSEKKGAQRVFLIDSYQRHNLLYDFDSLTVQLIENFTALKPDAIIMSLTAMTPHVIEAKEKILRERIWKCCALSALGGVVPIPGVSLAIDADIVLKEAMFYREQLGLEEVKLKQVAESFEMPWEVFKENTKLQSTAITYTRDGIIQFCSHRAVSEGLQDTVTVAIPVFGSMIGAGMSYYSTKCTLESLIDLMIDDAKKLNEFGIKQSMSTAVL